METVITLTLHINKFITLSLHINKMTKIKIVLHMWTFQKGSYKNSENFYDSY